MRATRRLASLGHRRMRKPDEIPRPHRVHTAFTPPARPAATAPAAPSGSPGVLWAALAVQIRSGGRTLALALTAKRLVCRNGSFAETARLQKRLACKNGAFVEIARLQTALACRTPLLAETARLQKRLVLHMSGAADYLALTLYTYD